MSATPRRLPVFANAGLLAGALAIVLALYRDFGITWDEAAQLRYGQLVLECFRAGTTACGANDFLDLQVYGPAFELLTALIPADGLARFELRHLVIALSGLCAVLGSMLASGSVGVAWASTATAIALLTMPRFFGHMFNNSKDVPFAATFTLAVAALAALLSRPGRSWSRVLLAGVAVGAAAAVRPGGAPLLGLLLGATLLASVWLERSAVGRAAIDAGLKGMVALGIAWLLMVLPWPWAHEAPIVRPLEAMQSAAAFHASYPVLFAGEVLPSTQLPRDYTSRFLLITVPPATLLLSLLGLLWSARQQRAALRTPRAMVLALLQLWLFAPLLLAAILRPNLYDGLRHFLFVLPALAAFAGLGAIAVCQRLRPGRARAAATLGVVFALLSPLPELVRLHPYQSSYFNLLVGGVGGAEGRYETDYWSSSYREAVQWLNDRVAREGRESVGVLVAANAFSLLCAVPYASERLRLSAVFAPNLPGDLPPGVDYYIGTYRYGLRHNFPDAPVVHRIGRDGAVFSVIRRRAARAPADRAQR